MRKFYKIILFILCSLTIFGSEKNNSLPPEVLSKFQEWKDKKELWDKKKQLTPDVIKKLKEFREKQLNGRKILNIKSTMLGMYADVVVPLEIISDIEVQALVIDDQDIVVPFEIEMSKSPNKKNYYKLNYSENKIDIDKDGKTDTYIYSNKYINNKIEKNNYVIIQGKNISKEGYHEKIVYINIEIND